MASKKPKLQIIIDDVCYAKFHGLAELDGRSESNFGAKIIREYIADYEKQNGEIEVEVVETK